MPNFIPSSRESNSSAQTCVIFTVLHRTSQTAANINIGEKIFQISKSCIRTGRNTGFTSYKTADADNGMIHRALSDEWRANTSEQVGLVLDSYPFNRVKCINDSSEFITCRHYKDLAV